MATLPQLLDVEKYRACDWDFKQDEAGRRYWVRVFEENLKTLMAAIRRAYPACDGTGSAEFSERYRAGMRAILEHPERYEQIDIMTFVGVRQNLQREFGFRDPYKPQKDFENEIALGLLPEILREVDAAAEGEREELLARNLMAGNLFDLGASAAMAHYDNHSADFYRLRETLPKRPWLVDDLAAWRDYWEADGGCRHAAIFVDNAGSDVVLGWLPMTRWMAGRGARVTLLANTEPTLNDVTAPELAELLEAASAIDVEIATSWRERRISVTGSGNWAPLIDLRELSAECVEAVRDADLIVLHGMGRGIETNYQASFSCPVLRTAVLKDEMVVERMGGRLFDCVFRFQR